MTSPEQEPLWRYLAEAPPPAPAEFAREPELGKAWQRLQILHTPSRTTDPDEYRWIVDWLASFERLLLEHPNLEPYYQECFASERGGSVGASMPARSPQIDHVATIQAQFMEEVFYVLSLDRHANASDNRGWMNLFRRWGRSATFNARLDELRSLLTMHFLTFYDLYLRNYPQRIDEEPVPHPWDSRARRRDPRGLDALPERTGGMPGPAHLIEDEPSTAGQRPSAPQQPEQGELPGIFLDPGIREAGRKPPRPGERPFEQPGSARPGPQDDAETQGRTRPGASGAEPGASAPDVPNE
jgi:hypothetical protein